MTTEQIVIDFLKTKDEHYINNLLASLHSDRETTTKEGTDLCPMCGSSHVKKNGSDGRGHQRYYCHDCHRTYSSVTGAFLFHSRITEEQWKIFIDHEITGSSLNELSYYTQLSMTTCFFMRHKLYRAAADFISKDALSGIAEIDALYLSINLKGTKKDKMPRKSKKRGQGSSYRGLSHHKICIISAIDENDNMMMKITGLGAESAEKYLECATRFKETEVIVSDSKSCIRQLANVIGAINENIPVYGGQKRYKTPAGRSLGSVNEMMTDISMIISRTRGFGTRYLDDYMSFNLFRKKLRYTVKRKDMRDYVYEKLIHSSQITLSDILKTIMPISLKEAYYEYGFGIFNEKKQHLS